MADQIQKLSEQTKGAVDDIGKIVHEVVKNTEKAVVAMEQSAKLTKTGMESIQKVGSSTGVITASNQKMSDQMLEMEKTTESIRLRSHEVAKAMEQISGNTKDNYKAIEHVTAATQENSTGMEEIEQMVTKVRKLAQELHEIRTDR